MTLTKDQIVDIIRGRSQFSAQEARKLVEMLLEEVKAKLEKGEDVKISGFGKWAVREKRSRPGRNPHTGAKIEITARRVVTFHPSDKMRDAVNNSNLDDTKMEIVSGGRSKDDDE